MNPKLVEQILTVLECAGFSGPRLVDAHSAVVAAMLGFVTLELAPMPAEDPTNWASRFEATIRSLDPAQFPTFSKYRDLMTNRAFIVRWQSGSQNPLNSGFEFSVDALIGVPSSTKRLAASTIYWGQAANCSRHSHAALRRLSPG